jgi:hypothetical protein
MPTQVQKRSFETLSQAVNLPSSLAWCIQSHHFGVHDTKCIQLILSKTELLWYEDKKTYLYIFSNFSDTA